MKTCNCGIFAGSLIVLSLLFFPSWPAHLCWARHIFPLPLFAFVNSLCRRSPSQTAGEGDTDCRLPASGGTLLLHTCQTSANTPFFPFQPEVDPLKHHARGSFRPEEIKVGMNVTTWAHTELLFFSSSSSHDSRCSPTTLDYLADACGPWLLRGVSINLAGGFKGQRFTEAQLIKFFMLPERTLCIPCLWNL